MSDQEEQTRDRRQAWKLLGTMEDHPQIQLWLQEAETGTAATSDVSQDAGISNSRKRGSRRVQWACAASVLLAVAIVLTLQFVLAPSRYATGIGEQRDVILADGSRITLNTATSLTVRYSVKHRRIDLERGEALFTVKHDAARPFDVTSGEIVTRALGTEFNVDVRSSRIVVSVLEGVVRVAAVEEATGTASDENAGSDHGAVPSLHVNALATGQAVQFSPTDRAFQQTKADLRRIAAWRTRRLEFSDAPFTEAIEEFNRYSATRMTIGTPELSDVRVSGVFRIGDVDGFLFSLREALHVEAHASDDEIVLMRAQR
jgi:transmembrane sensor